jgi:predicted RecA/RadA family phage recombinase
MKNYIQKGETMDVVLAGTKVAGDPLVVGSLVGVLKSGGVNGDTVTLSLKGVFEIAKTAAQAAAKGAIYYWDDTAKKVSTSDGSGANLKIGYAFEAAAGADATAQVLLER